MNVRRPELFSKSDIRVVLFLTVAILIGGAVVIFEKSREVIYPEVVIRQLENAETRSGESEIKAGELSESMLLMHRININTAPVDSLRRLSRSAYRRIKNQGRAVRKCR
jgi:hypothetical protein